MLFRQIFDPKLAQYAYLVGCQRTGEAVLVDPQRDVDRYIDLAREVGMRITAVTETHIHADFLSGSRQLAEAVGARLFLSDEGDADWKYQWLGLGDYDITLLKDGDRLRVGGIELTAVHSPGHTPEHLSFLVTDHGAGASEPMGLISGDFVFVGDLGRPDLLESAAGQVGAMEPSARQLFSSVQRVLELPDFLQIWPGHGAGSACGKALGAVPSSTIGYERRFNAAISAAGRGEDAFVESILEGQPEPPLYFARMKQLNRDGVPLLGELPKARPVTAQEAQAAAADENIVVVDTRLDRSAFMAGHLEGSLYAPLNKSFPTIVGSCVLPGQPILLIVDEGHLEEAVRDLVRIGYDNIAGFLPPEDLVEMSGLVSTRTAQFSEMASLVLQPDSLSLDVRTAAEFSVGHVPGALHIPHTRLLDRLEEVPTGDTLLVYCGSGFRAAVASALLERHGFQVCYVDGYFRPEVVA